VEIQLAGGSRKRVFLLLNISSGGTGELEFRLVNARGRLLARHEDSGAFSGGGRAMFVVLPGKDHLPSLAGAYSRALGTSTLDLVTVDDPGRLPEHWPAWSRADIVLASETDFGLMSEEQKRAIREWVWMGGVLVFAPGSNPAWLQDPFVQSLAPSGRVETAPWPAAIELALAPDPGLRNAGYVFEHEGTSLGTDMEGAGWKWKRGRGTVVALAFDVNHPLFVARPDRLDGFTQRFCIRMMPPAPTRGMFDLTRGGWERERFLESIGNGLVEYPSTGFLMVLLILYVALVGPLNFLFLRSRHRSALTVVTVPLLGLVATSALVGIRFVLRDRAGRANRVTVIEQVPGTGRAMVREHIVAITEGSITRRFESGTGRLWPVPDWRNDDTRVSNYRGETLHWSLQPQEPVRISAVGSREFGSARALWDGSAVEVTNETDVDFEKLLIFDLKTGALQQLKGIARGARGRFPWRGSGTLGGRYFPAENWSEQTLWSCAYAHRTADGVVLLAVLATPGPDTRLEGEPMTFVNQATVLLLPVEKRK
jgi:hypothetical protein